MAPEVDIVIDAALRLSPEQQRVVIRTLSEKLSPKRRGAGDVTKFFGTFHSDDPRGGDNDKIDADLADSYMDTHDTED